MAFSSAASDIRILETRHLQALSEVEEEMNDQERYFLQDTRTMVGNCMLFWAKDSIGYTTNLDAAELFTLEEAMSHRKTDRPWPESLMRRLAKPRVDFQNLPSPEQFERLK